MLDAPYVPTPHPIVRRMLQLADVKPGEVVYDLGAGDGRIVIEAAREFGAYGVGVELDPGRYSKIQERVRRLGLKEQVTVLHQSYYDTSLRDADVVTLYLLPKTNLRLRWRFLSELKPTARIVAHDYPIPGLKADRTIYVKYGGSIHKLYLYHMSRIKPLRC